jgi:membrane-associated phospholipid phosphatase
VGVAGMGSLMTLYILIAQRAAESPRTSYTLALPIDDAVGLHPWAVLIYGALYLQILAPLVLIGSRQMLARALAAVLVVVLSGVPFWLLWPVTVPRHPVPVDDLFTWGIAVVRFLDPPTNCFPSMHVAESFLAALLIRRLDRTLGSAMLLSAAAIWWSTLALDQHWFVDGLAGMLLAVAADRGVFRRPLPASALRPAPRRHLLWALGVYLLLFIAFALPWWTGAVAPEALSPRW